MIAKINVSESPGSSGDAPTQTKSPNPGDHVYGTFRPVKAIIVGAGIAGIATACILSKKVQNLIYTVYDKNDKVGGTWAENFYPGVRCDVPSHVYQLTFAPNAEWSEYYSKGAEIQKYYEDVCDQYGVNDNLKLRHQVVGATWIPAQHEWEVQVENLETGEIYIDQADFFIAAQGRTNKPSWPQVANLDDFQGQIVHTAKWDKSIDYRNKRVAVIGNGASGQQIIPNIVSDVAHLDHYVRSKAYVTPTIRESLIRPTKDNPGAHTYSEKEIIDFKKDADAYLEYRKSLDKGMSGKWYAHTLGSAETEAFKKLLLDEILSRANGDPDWLKRLKPDYEPGCKRLTPGAGYIESLLDPKVDFVDTKILKATKTGIQTEDGKQRDVEIIILATGFRDGFYPRFPTIGNDGDLGQNWRPDGKVGYPATYLGVMAPHTPNYFNVLQAQGNAFGGSVPLHCEVTAAFISRVIRKLQRDGYRACSPSQAATDDFNDSVETYFANSVVQSGCSSWFKLGGGSERVVVGWPGTTRHRIETLAEPRWEDFEFERSSGKPGAGVKGTRFWFWGDGNTAADRETDYNVLLSHLQKPAEVDFSTLHDSAY